MRTKTALSGAQPLTPVSRAPCMVRKGNDKDYTVTFANDHAIRKTPEEQTLDAVRARDAEQRCKRDDLLLKNIQSRIDCIFEIRPESGPLTFVPRGSFGGLFDCGRVDTYYAHQARLMRARIRRLNSARSMSFAVPASISASRRRISASQASSTPGSGAPSRLATSCCASSARSGSDSFRASARSFSSVELPMPHAPLRDEAILYSIAYRKTVRTRVGRVQLDSRDFEPRMHGVGLSGGQKQTLAIARAVSKRAPLLIFDEATNGLDQATSEELAQTVNKLKRGATILFIAHQLPRGLAVDELEVLSTDRTNQMRMVEGHQFT